MLLVRIEPEDGQVRLKSVRRKSDGQEFQIPEQTVWVYGVDKDGNQDRHPYRSQVSLEKGQKPYEPGDYTIHPFSCRFNNYGSAVQMNMRLIPIDHFAPLLKKTLFERAGK
ncbi:single-stranded DNA-binding protein [Chromobacterium amazonense]|uniref:single-stranded DNA-binding protein n=1 Tax=Chromobacterium amazonense TaxID=1382803 RepID=UPI00237D5427|nr:single-stranded DNA-binding protein [Chromobacterium amazonense]MDE1715940.1 single-stranded DNA-binding protein [Chromobacterium amazonense]